MTIKTKTIEECESESEKEIERESTQKNDKFRGASCPLYSRQNCHFSIACVDFLIFNFKITLEKPYRHDKSLFTFKYYK